jgi:hypothetical protein
MSVGGAMVNASFACGTTRCSGAREALIVVAMLYGLTQGAEALADDPSISAVRDIEPLVGGRPLSSAFLPSKSASSELQFSSSEFRERKPGLEQAPPPADAESFTPTQAFQTTSAWQRLADYRSQGRVQLLTLWESKHSFVSLQSGKHGGPSLQWTSRLMNRGGATRGLLDRFVASSLGAAGLGSKSNVRSPNPSAANRSMNLQPASKLP